MSFNGPAYGAAKKLTESIASGFDHAVRTGDNTFSIFFVNGSKIDLTIPLPKDGTDGKDGKDGEKGDTGLSITGATFNSSGKLVIELSDGSFLAPVTMPSASVDVSQAEGNCLEQKADGMFVAKTDISNLVEKETGKGLSSNDYTDEDKKNISDNKDAIDKLNGDDSTIGSVAYQIADALGRLNKLSKKIVEVLPSADEADANTIYMVKEDGGNYAMYTVVTLADGSKSLASMGSTDIDLTDYMKTENAKITYLALADVKKDVLALLDSTTENDIVYLTYNGSKILTKSQIETLFEDYTTKQYVDDEVDKKVDKTDITKTLDATKTDEQVPSAKAVFDELENKIDKEYGTSHKGEVLVIGEDGKVTAKAFDVIDDSATESTTTTLSAKKINDSLVDINANLGEISNSLKIERKIIYTNANNVGDTTISNVDFDGLLFIVVLVNFGNASGEFYSSFVTIPIITNGAIVLSANNIAGITRTRRFEMHVEEGIIKLGNGYQGSTANNSYCLPRAIYGYYQK